MGADPQTMMGLNSSMRGWSEARRRWALAICLLLGGAVAVMTGLRMGYIFEQADTNQYLAIAAGGQSMLPFAARQLGPLVVRGLARFGHMTVEQGFFVEGTVALLVFLGTVVWLLLSSGAPRWMLAAVTGMFFWSFQFNGLVLPDIFYAALLCVFLLLLREQRMMAAAVMMFPLAVARESTLLTLVCLLIAGRKLLRAYEMGTALLATAAGLMVVKRLTSNALPNYEHISPLLYLFAKMPWNFIKNFTGFTPWANVYRSCEVPRWQMPLHVRPLQAIGICGWSADYPGWIIFQALACFGLLPLLAWKVWGGRSRLEQGRSSLMVRFCLVYGLISFGLAGVLGESFQRLFGYSWPLFLVGVPMLLGAAGGNFRSTRGAVAFVALQWALTWLNLQLHYKLLVWAVVFWAAGWWLIKREFYVAANEPDASSAGGG